MLGINLGLVLERCNEYDAAAKNFQQAVAIYTNSYPKTHELYQSAVEGLKRVSLTNTEWSSGQSNLRVLLRNLYPIFRPASRSSFSVIYCRQRKQNEKETLWSVTGNIQSPSSSIPPAAADLDHRWAKIPADVCGQFCFLADWPNTKYQH